MSLIDLEILKWRYFRTWHTNTANKAQYTSLSRYWMESGAFLSILPRQSGKTTAMIKMATDIIQSGEKACLFVLNRHIAEQIQGRNPLLKGHVFTNWYPPGVRSNYHCFIDEFMLNKQLDSILTNDWKSVTGLSSMR